MIPKIIHRIWIEGDEPAWLREFGMSWEHHHPDWFVKTWTDDLVPYLFPLEGETQRLWDNADKYVDFGHLPQFRADILRYTLLLRYGGVYVDADFQCLRSINPLVNGLDQVISAWEVPGAWMVNGFLGAPPQHWFVQRLIQELPSSCKEHRGEAPTRLSGPQFLSKVATLGRDKEADAFSAGALRVYPTEYFFPYQPTAKDVKRFPVDYRFDPEEWPDLYAVHVWRNKRRKMGMLEGLE